MLAQRSLLQAFGWSQYLLPFLPIAVALEVAHADPVIVFAASALGVIPTASLMGTATEQLAARSGPGIGGLLNVTFGNAPELIIALFALGAGLHEVVKASIIGSILGNILLVMGAAMLVGGLKRERQYFDRTAASVQSIMLLLAIAALVMPALFELIEGIGLPNPGDERVNYDSTVEQLSFAVAVVLIFTYVAGLVFSLRTHRELFNPVHEEEEHEGEPWSVRRAVIALAIAGALVGLMSEILVGSISKPLNTSAIGCGPSTNEHRTRIGPTKSAICALDPIAMFTARSILSLDATSTATQCSAALPTVATTITPTKNSLRPMDFEASEIEPTRISDMMPTATPATASAITLLRTVQCSPTWSSSSCSGLKRSLCVRSEKTSPAT